MSIKGYSGENKLDGEQLYATVTPQGSGKNGLDVQSKALFPISTIDATIVSNEFIQERISGRTVKSHQNIEITGHLLRVGDVIRFNTSGS